MSELRATFFRIQSRSHEGRTSISEMDSDGEAVRSMRDEDSKRIEQREASMKLHMGTVDCGWQGIKLRAIYERRDGSRYILDNGSRVNVLRLSPRRYVLTRTITCGSAERLAKRGTLVGPSEYATKGTR